MAVPSVMTDLSATIASNSPAGSDAIGTTLDDYLRAIQGILRKEQSQGAAVASAATTNIGATTDGNYIHITGVTTITSFGTVAAGIERTVVFDGALILTNSVNLILPGGTNITTAAGDAAQFISEGSGVWRCLSYSYYTNLVSTSKMQPITATVAANAMTINLSSTVLDFRSPTLTTGTPNTRSVSPITLTISAGSTLGTAYVATYNLNYRIYVVAIDATSLGGSVELAAINVSGAGTSISLDETGLITTVAEGGAGAADTAGVFYSTTARANVPYRMVGYVEGVLNTGTNGNWTSITTVQAAGGAALDAMSSVGYGQSWQSVSRTSGVTYYNTTGKPIYLHVLMSTGVIATSGITINGLSVSSISAAANTGQFQSVIIPVGASYSHTSTNLVTCFELR